MLGCALVQQGHRKALTLGRHLQEHLVDHDEHLVDQDDHHVEQDDTFSTSPPRIPC